jgi:hypothetical protein
MCVSRFSAILSEIFFILRRDERGMTENIHWSSRKVPFYSCHILMKLEFSRQIFAKSSNTEFHENPSSESRVPCGQTDGREMTKLIVAFRCLVNAPKNGSELTDRRQ